MKKKEELFQSIEEMQETQIEEFDKEAAVEIFIAAALKAHAPFAEMSALLRGIKLPCEIVDFLHLQKHMSLDEVEKHMSRLLRGCCAVFTEIFDMIDDCREDNIEEAATDE